MPSKAAIPPPRRAGLRPATPASSPAFFPNRRIAGVSTCRGLPYCGAGAFACRLRSNIVGQALSPANFALWGRRFRLPPSQPHCGAGAIACHLRNIVVGQALSPANFATTLWGRRFRLPTSQHHCGAGAIACQLRNHIVGQALSPANLRNHIVGQALSPANCATTLWGRRYRLPTSQPHCGAGAIACQLRNIVVGQALSPANFATTRRDRQGAVVPRRRGRACPARLGPPRMMDRISPGGPH